MFFFLNLFNIEHLLYRRLVHSLVRIVGVSLNYFNPHHIMRNYVSINFGLGLFIHAKRSYHHISRAADILVNHSSLIGF